MMHENIRYFRKQKGISQEELADRLHVVRQTVSKWENGLSVPDADVLLAMADVLEVSVDQLLGIEVDDGKAQLSEEVEKQNTELANVNRVSANSGWILTLPFIALVIGICVIAFIIALLGVCNVITFSDNDGKLFALALVSGIMVYVGRISTRLPDSRLLGLCLPWIVRDEETGKLAHRILCQISLPLILLYIVCAWTFSDFVAVSIGIVLMWISIPGAISGIFFYKKYYGR